MTTLRSLYTSASFSANQGVKWEMLSNDQCEDIFLTVLELLERTGADVKSEKALEIFKNGGCWVEGNRVKIPSSVAECAVRTAPSRVTLCDQAGKRAMRLEANNAYFGPGYGNELIIDPATGEIRKPLKGDVAKTAILCDGLKNIDFVMSNGLPTEVNPKIADVHAFEALVTNTKKPIIQSVSCTAQMQDILDISAEVAGGLTELQKNPFVALLINTEEALSHSAESLEQVILAAENKIPFIYSSKVIAGDSAPSSPAGAIVVSLANALVGIVLSQLVNQGAPAIAGGFMSIKDSEGKVLLGAPEVSLMSTGMANVFRYIGIPSFATAGMTDSKNSDAQLGLESAFSILGMGLCGANVVHGCGQTENGLTGSLDLLTMSDEIVGIVGRICRGIEVDEERLARGVYEAIGPGGHYMGEEHTLKYFKKEFYWPTLMNRLRIQDWEANGSKTLGQRTNDKTQDIINTHQVESLSVEVLNNIKVIVERAEARVANK